MKVPVSGFECPTCHVKFNTATRELGKANAPREGDAGVCASCGEVLVLRIDRLVIAEQAFVDALPQKAKDALLVMQARAKNRASA